MSHPVPKYAIRWRATCEGMSLSDLLAWVLNNDSSWFSPRYSRSSRGDRQFEIAREILTRRVANSLECEIIPGDLEGECEIIPGDLEGSK